MLVNNAGYGYLAAVEEGEEKDIRAIFETNFFGVAQRQLQRTRPRTIPNT